MYLYEYMNKMNVHYQFSGPLTYNDDGRETVVGVVSFGDKLCSHSTLVNGSVAVYARVTEQLEWIKDEMEKN